MKRIAPWSRDELALLAEWRPYCTDNEISALLGRSLGSVKYQVRVQHLQRQIHLSWTEEEKALLLRLRHEFTHTEIARFLGRTTTSVKSLIKSQMAEGVAPRLVSQWSDEERRLVERLRVDLAPDEIGMLIGRSRKSVERFLYDLGYRAPERSWWSNEEIEIVVRLWPINSNTFISRMLGRRITSIARLAHRLGLRKDRTYLASIGHFHHLLPQEAREAIALRNKLRRILHDAEHQDAARRPVRRAGIAPTRSAIK